MVLCIERIKEMIFRFVLGIIIGGGFGAMLGYFGKCSSGACPLTANPFRGAFFGAIIGAVLLSMYATNKAEMTGAVNNSKEKEKMIVNIGSAEAFEKIMQSKGIYVIDFYAPWCQPCRILSPVIEKLSENYKGKATFVKVDVNELMETAQQFGITGTPTVVILKDGSVMQRIVGLRGESEYAKTIDKYL
jgi:thioredoxin 1